MTEPHACVRGALLAALAHHRATLLEQRKIEPFNLNLLSKLSAIGAAIEWVRIILPIDSNSNSK